jgi:hypothetical protein
VWGIPASGPPDLPARLARARRRDCRQTFRDGPKALGEASTGRFRRRLAAGRTLISSFAGDRLSERPLGPDLTPQRARREKRWSVCGPGLDMSRPIPLSKSTSMPRRLGHGRTTRYSSRYRTSHCSQSQPAVTTIASTAVQSRAVHRTSCHRRPLWRHESSPDGQRGLTNGHRPGALGHWRGDHPRDALSVSEGR